MSNASPSHQSHPSRTSYENVRLSRALVNMCDVKTTDWENYSPALLKVIRIGRTDAELAIGGPATAMHRGLPDLSTVSTHQVGLLGNLKLVSLGLSLLMKLSRTWPPFASFNIASALSSLGS